MGNIPTIVAVISVVVCALGIAFVGTYYLNKAVDRTD